VLMPSFMPLASSGDYWRRELSLVTSSPGYLRLLWRCSIVAQMSLRCGPVVAQSFHCRSDVSPMSLRCHSGVSRLSLRCCLSGVAPMSLRCRSDVAPMSLRCLYVVSPLSLRCHSARLSDKSYGTHEADHSTCQIDKPEPDNRMNK